MVNDPFDHVIVLMFENRSFDQMLGSFNTAYPDLNGIDRAAPRTNLRLRNKKRFKQAPTTARILKPGPAHEQKNVMSQLYGLRPTIKGLDQDDHDGGGFVFDYDHSNLITTDEQCAEVMNYYDIDTLPALHTLARNFTVCDAWHASVPGPTWTNRFFVHSGTSIGRVEMPASSLPWYTYTQATIYDRLTARGVPWRIYYTDFPQSLLLVNQHEPAKLKNYRNVSEFGADFHSKDFPAYTFIEPGYFPLSGQNDYHPPSDLNNGERFLAKIYNSIRSNPTRWERTLLIVTFDEHGGFYDHVFPPAAPPPDMHDEEYDFKLLGLRVPALLISPYTPARVEHERFDHTSILRYLADRHALAPLSARVEAATSIAVAFQATKALGPDHVPETTTKLKRVVSDPGPIVLDAGASLAIQYSAHLEDRTDPDPVIVQYRRTLGQLGPEGQMLVSIDRVRDYLKQHQG